MEAKRKRSKDYACSASGQSSEDDPFMVQSSSFIKLPCPPAAIAHTPTSPRQRPVKVRMVSRSTSTISRDFGRNTSAGRNLVRFTALALLIAGAVMGYMHFYAPEQLTSRMAASTKVRWNRAILQWPEVAPADNISPQPPQGDTSQQIDEDGET